MKKNRIFTSTLIAASFALSVPALAETTYLPTSTSGSDSPTASNGVIATGDYAIASGETQGWFIPWATSGGAGSYSLSFGENTTFSGTGLIGIFFNQGSGDTPESVDLTNVTASGLTGQLIVLNNWNNETDVKLLGDSWANVEYLFANAVDDTTLAEKYGLTGITRGDLANSDFSTKGLNDYLALQGNTTLAGVTGASKGVTIYDNQSNPTVLCEHEFITVANNGDTLTIAGSGEYAFYGTAGTESARLSLVMNSSDGNGSQTFGGTNYLQDVTVTKGTLALGGTTSITGSVSVASGGTLELAGEVSLSYTISNSGTIVIADGTTFVLGDGVTSGHVEGSLIGYYEIVDSNSGSISYTADGTYTFIHNGNTLDGWSIYVTDTGSVYAYGEAGEYSWNGTSDNNKWNTDTSNTNWTIGTEGDSRHFVNGSDVTFGTDAAYKTVDITESLSTGSIAIEDDYTFTTSNSEGVTVDAGGDITIASGKTLTVGEGVTLYFDHEATAGWSLGEGAISGSGTLEFRFTENYGDTINLGSDTTFTGTVYIVAGDFQFSGSNIGEGTYRVGDKVNMQQGSGNASVTVNNNIIIEGSSDLHVNSGGSLTINGTLTGEGTLTRQAAGSLTVTGNVDLGGFTVNAASTNTFTGDTVNIGAYSTTGAGSTLVLGEGTQMTAKTFSASWHETVTLGEGAVLTVTEELSVHTNDNDTFSGGTINAQYLHIYNASTTATFSNGTLNIGSGGIRVESSGYVGFGDGLTVGVYAGTNENTSWSTSATIQFIKSTTGTGTTFYTEAGQSITLSGTLTGAGFSNTGSGTLTLSGTVELSSAITNSGTIVIDSNTMFVLDNLKSDGHGTYVIIDNVDSGSITGWTSLTTSNFSFSDGTTINSVTVTTDGQVTISTDAKDLIWNGGSSTWDTSSSNWVVSGTQTSSTFANGDYVTFTGSTGDSTAITVSSDVSAAYVTVEGGTYSFSGSNITAREYFVINSGAEVDLNSGNSTIYGDVVVDGTLKLAGSGGGSGEIHGTITINNGGWVELDVGDATGYNDGGGVTAITINKGGELYVGTTDNQTLGGCELVLVGGTIDGVSGSNLDFYIDSKLIVKAAEGASADNPTVSTVTNVMLTSRNDDGTTEVRVEENAVLDVQSGFWSGPNSQSSYNGNIEKTGAGTLEVTGYFAINTGSLIIDAGTVILSGTAGNSDLSYGFASTISVAEGANLEICFKEGDATVGSVTSSGTLKITGTTLTVTGAASIADLTLAGGSIVFSSSSANTITLSSVAVSGESKIAIGLDANNDYNDKVVISSLSGTGTLSLDGAARTTAAAIFELTGTSSQFTGTISLSESENQSDYRGITLVISSASAAAGAVIEMGAEARNNSCIALGVNAETVEIAGLTSTNSGGDVVYSGSVSLGATLGNQGATLIDYKNQSGYGTNSNYDGVSTSRNTLVINTAEGKSYSFSGVFMDMLNIEKKGAGTQSITFNSSVGTSAYYFDGTITVTEGTLNLDGRATNSAGITVAKDATLNIANDITLTKASDLDSCTSTISGNLGLSGTLTVASDATLEIGSTASVTISSAIVNEGSITIAEGASIVVGSDLTKGTYTDGNNGDVGYYVLIDGGEGNGSVTLNGSVTFVIGDESVTLNSLLQRYADSNTWNIYSEGGYLVIYEATTTATTADTLYWAGSDGNSTWSTNESNTPWSATDGGEAGLYFADEANVIFGASAESKTVAVVGEVAPGSITVNGEYTFAIGEEASVKTGALTYGDGGSLTLTGTGSFIFDGETTSTDFTISTSDEFTGTLEVAKGLLDLSKVSLGTSTKLVIDAIGDPDTNGAYTTSNSNAILFDATNNTLANDLTIAGSSGGVILRSAGTEITLSGSVTGDDGTTLQLNGNGTANFTGKVSLSNYINYQGATVFKNETTLGSLEIYQAESNKGDVTFTGSAAKATVTALTIAQTGGSGTATLTVSDGASLSVGTMTIDHDFAIAIDKATMSITGTVTQTSGTSTSVTISDGGQLSLGSNVSLNVDVMNIVLGEANYDEGNSGSGTFAIVGDTGSSLTFTDSAAITITVDSALETLLSSEGTYYFDISDGIVLTEDNLDWSTLERYGTVSYTDGILSVVVGPIPEPSMFGVFAGLGTLLLVSTRRRRRKAA